MLRHVFQGLNPSGFFVQAGNLRELLPARRQKNFAARGY